MTIKTKMLFILIGDDRTGKTTLQKLLIEKLCSHSYGRLPVNIEFNIIHPEIVALPLLKPSPKLGQFKIQQWK
ncbi:hypothetical protein [Allomuricauda sp. NBRC 101325]|uniref:hypothetical protein n=1 Tax=Allomuricauda sp. NBRC 101325 TaxID=1113758 RepID=UPI0025541884|nr:hypothetical protein [Muricauda sp. NBRC 101325]